MEELGARSRRPRAPARRLRRDGPPVSCAAGATPCTLRHKASARLPGCVPSTPQDVPGWAARRARACAAGWLCELVVAAHVRGQSLHAYAQDAARGQAGTHPCPVQEQPAAHAAAHLRQLGLHAAQLLERCSVQRTSFLPACDQQRTRAYATLFMLSGSRERRTAAAARRAPQVIGDRTWSRLHAWARSKTGEVALEMHRRRRAMRLRLRGQLMMCLVFCEAQGRV